MTNKLVFGICTLGCVLVSTLAQAQDTLFREVYDPHSNVRTVVREVGRNKIIPDKVFEFGVPLLLIFMVLNTIITIFKIRAEAGLKEKALDKGISEGTLIELFREDKQMLKNIYLKWFLILAGLGVALLYVHFLHQFVQMSSSYMAVGMICLFISIAFLIYYRIIRKQ